MRHDRWSASAAVRGTKKVDASPPASVTMVSARVVEGPPAGDGGEGGLVKGGRHGEARQHSTGEEQRQVRGGGGDDEDAQHAEDGAGRHDRRRFARGREACACDISDVGVSQPTVSHHLKKLREAGLLTSERRGTWVYCRVEPSVPATMGQLLSAAA